MNNQLSGTLPDSWSNMAAIERLDLSFNRFVGTVPASWGGWANAKVVALALNAGLTGCLPRTWRGQLVSPSRDSRIPSRLNSTRQTEVDDARLLEVFLKAGTAITGFC